MLCNFCYSPSASLRCSRCTGTHYCSKSCQTNDWKIGGQGSGHKAWCGVERCVQNLDWTIQPVAGKGMGIVALRPIAKDKRIIVDRMFSDQEFFDPDFRLKTKALELAGGPSMQSKYITNCIGSIDDRGHFGGLCMLISRANHACDPTAVTYYDPETKCMLLHAARDIAPGEEITISYTEFLDPFTVGPRSVYEAHQESLRTQYGIVCPDDCACKSEAHLQRKRRSDELELALIDKVSAAVASPDLPEIVAKAGMEWIRYHDDFPLRTRYRVRLNTLGVGHQVGIALEGLCIYELACKLTRPGSKDAERHAVKGGLMK